MDEHPTLGTLLQEHIPAEMMVAWTLDALKGAGFDSFPPRQEDIPDGVVFQVHQRALLHLAERTPEPLATELREAYRQNAAAGRILGDEPDDREERR